MLIDKIVLDNYRVYQGQNTVSFDYDYERNITIISGNNGFGKTSFLTSLVWCLYGKLMVDVDERYKKEIQESGGYKRYCERTINRNFLRQYENNISSGSPSFSVTILLSGVQIPGIPCDSIEIKRTYTVTTTGDEALEVLLDGRTNELTKEMGPEIFINDFILPREIAKFFFFDAEKIVSLAEMRSVEEKKQLSRAYSEVLGIKKYEDLKHNLENIRLKLRKNTNIENDKKRFNELNNAITDNDRLLNVYHERIEVLRENILRKKSEADKLQERLIREGSTITLEELKGLKQIRENAASESKYLKGKMSELLDFAPFAIASKKFSEVYKQALREDEAQNEKISGSFLQRKLAAIRTEIAAQKKKLNIQKDTEQKLYEILQAHLQPGKNGNAVKQLLGFTTIEWNELLSILENLKSSYSKQIKEISQRSKVNQSTYSIVNSKLRDAETKETDLVIKEIRIEKDKCDREVESLEDELVTTQAKAINLSNENTNLKKLISEVSKKVHVAEADSLKDVQASRLIDELSLFTQKLKQQKKQSLETNILAALRKLMHKADFIVRVEVLVGDDIIDIELYDKRGKQINKDGLSKGEQQLYATAILKALVDESNIRFPLFIDSPLQKFDKKHAYNIVTEFYPTISEQVVLFPLLEKELSSEEYGWLLRRINKVFLIEHKETDYSTLREIEPDLLFEKQYA